MTLDGLFTAWNDIAYAVTTVLALLGFFVVVAFILAWRNAGR